jgi:hypothetical protein
MRIFWPTRSVPSITRTITTAPRYESYQLSNTSARSVPSGSPLGGGTRLTIASRISLMPMPALALAGTASLQSRPITSSTSWRARSTSAPGRSILLNTGTISRLFSSAK